MGVVASPSVRKLAAQRGVDIEVLAARLGRETIAREDVLGQTIQPGSDASLFSNYWDVDHAEWGPVTIEPLGRLAVVASANLTAAHKMIPAVTHHDSADLTRIEATRATLKAEGTRVTALAFHVVVLARCLREFPRFNSSLSADGKSLILKDYLHIGLAVETPHGLSVPVLRDVDRMGVSFIGDAITDLANRARTRKLRPYEMGGASMTLSNLGGIGGESFTPIINPPEVAILGLSSLQIKPVWDGEFFQPTPMVPMSLTYDHRVIDGADAARFTKRYRELISNPDDLIV